MRTLTLSTALLALLSACPRPASVPEGVVVTLAPAAALTQALVGPGVPVRTLLPPGASPHGYAPRPSDLARAEGAALLVTMAPHVDEWAEGFPAPRRHQLFDGLSRQAQRPTPGLEGHAHPDPHFWLDPLAVAETIPALAQALCEAKAAPCEEIQPRSQALQAALRALDLELRAQLAPLQGAGLLVSEPFLTYFAPRYGLKIIDTIEPAPGKAPSPRQVLALIERARAEGARAVVVQARLPVGPARVVAESAALPLITLDPIAPPGGSGYEALLRWNAAQLLEALQ